MRTKKAKTEMCGRKASAMTTERAKETRSAASRPTPTPTPREKATTRKKPDPASVKRRIAQESVETRRRAALILEVLGGVRTPTEAAEALGVSVPRYYALEARALEGLVHSCRPRPRGRQQTPEREVKRLRAEVERLRRESQRTQALLRAQQRAVGLKAAASSGRSKSSKSSRNGAKEGGAGGFTGAAARGGPKRAKRAGTGAMDGGADASTRKRRKRRPTARALRAVTLLTRIEEASSALRTASDSPQEGVNAPPSRKRRPTGE